MNEAVQKVENITKGVRLMVGRQHAINSKVNPEWWTAEYPFYRAAWKELGEAMEFLSWEWWKKSGVGNFKDVQGAFGDYCLELVDALHFCTSAIMQEVFGTRAKPDQIEMLLDQTATKISAFLANTGTGCHGALFYGHTPGQSLVELTEDAALTCLYKLPKNVYSILVSAAAKVGIGFPGLLAFYMGKNVLNIFRQDHGYKSGAYVKAWDEHGNEDNFYLAEAILEWLSPLTEADAYRLIFSGEYQDQILATLEQKYLEVLTMQPDTEETTA